MKTNKELLDNFSQLKNIEATLSKVGDFTLESTDDAVVDTSTYKELANGYLLPSFDISQICFDDDDDDSSDEIVKCKKCNTNNELVSYDFCELCDSVFCAKCAKRCLKKKKDIMICKKKCN